MKAKLLRKVRKRYSIFKFPNGVKLWGKTIKDPTILLYDGNDVLNNVVIKKITTPRIYSGDTIFVCSEVEGLKHLKEAMLINILREYSAYGVRRNAKLLVAEKLYYRNENITNK
jgi:hypothetical protein